MFYVIIYSVFIILTVFGVPLLVAVSVESILLIVKLVFGLLNLEGLFGLFKIDFGTNPSAFIASALVSTTSVGGSSDLYAC